MPLSNSSSVWLLRFRVRWRAYAFALLATIVTIGLRVALTPWLNDRPTLVLFAVPIALSAYMFGVGPGLVSTALAVLASLLLGLTHSDGLTFSRSEDAAQLLLLVLVGLFLSLMNPLTLWSRRGAYDRLAERGFLATIRKVQGSLAFALALTAVIGGISYFSLQRLAEDARKVAHTHAVLEHLDTLRELRRETQQTRRAFIATADDTSLRQHLAVLANMRTEVARIRELTTDSPAQQSNVDQLAGLVDTEQGLTNRISGAKRPKGFDAAARSLADQSLRVDTALEALLPSMISAQKQLLEQREAGASASSRFARLNILIGSALAFLLVGAALLAIRRDFAGRLSAELELERFFSLSLDFLCISSGDGYFKRVSPAVTEMLGWSVPEFLSHPYLYFIHPDDHAATLREVERQLTTGESVLKFENRYRHKDGSWRVLSWRSMPQPDGLMYATARDVTDIKTAELGLVKANQTLEDRVADRTAELAHANIALNEQLSRLALLSRITHAIGERGDMDSVFGIVAGTLENELPSDFCCILHYDEADAFTVATIGPVTASMPVHLSLSQHTIEKSASGLATCLNGELQYEPNLALTEAPFLQELFAHQLASLVAAPLRSEGKVVGALLVARRAVESFSLGERDFLCQLSEHVALAARQAQLYAALQSAYDDLSSSQQAVMQQERLRVLGQMASGIAHDINNSISPVTIYAKLLERERNLSDQGREFLRIIQQQVRDVGDTVARLREFYRPASPDQHFTAVQLNDLLPQLVHLTRARWSDMPQQRGIVVRVQLDLAANLPVVRGIESEIREALTNLIFNAVDAMPNGGVVTLRTASRSLSNGKSNVDVEVADTGIGMDPITLRRCLEPFFTTKGDRGSGLGLAMVYGIAQRHGGNITVDSQLGVGTTVRMTFASTIGDESSPIPADERISLRPLRILIVDDDLVLLKALREMLEAEGHSIVAVDKGESAIQTFKSECKSVRPFDAVITDLGMPHVDGRQVAATIKALAPETMIIMLTGWGRLLEAADVPRHVDRLLSKPPTLRELQHALAKSNNRS